MTNFYLLINGEQRGPYSESQVRAMYNSGGITSDIHYWQEGQSDWLPVDGLFAQSPGIAQPPPFINSSQTKPVAKKSSGLTIILFVVSFCAACYAFSNLQRSEYENKLKDAADFAHSESSDLQAAGNATGISTDANQIRDESDADYIKMQNQQDSRVGRVVVAFLLSGFCFICALLSMLINKS